MNRGESSMPFVLAVSALVFCGAGLGVYGGMISDLETKARCPERREATDLEAGDTNVSSLLPSKFPALAAEEALCNHRLDRTCKCPCLSQFP